MNSGNCFEGRQMTPFSGNLTKSSQEKPSTVENRRALIEFSYIFFLVHGNNALFMANSYLKAISVVHTVYFYPFLEVGAQLNFGAFVSVLVCRAGGCSRNCAWINALL